MCAWWGAATHPAWGACQRSKQCVQVRMPTLFHFTSAWSVTLKSYVISKAAVLANIVLPWFLVPWPRSTLKDLLMELVAQIIHILSQTVKWWHCGVWAQWSGLRGAPVRGRRGLRAPGLRRESGRRQQLRAQFLNLHLHQSERRKILRLLLLWILRPWRGEALYLLSL